MNFIGWTAITNQKKLHLLKRSKYFRQTKKKKANLNIALTEIDKIAEQYNVDLSDAQNGKKGKVEKPVLIISESFE